MNFTDVIKKEILSKPIKDNHCKLAFIAGLVRGSGQLYEKDGELGLDFKAFDEDTAMLISNYFRTLFSYEIREISVSEDRLNKKDRFVISISGEELYNILTELDVLVEVDGEQTINFNFYSKLTKKECCLKAFIRGLFVASGSCTTPTIDDNSTTGYHLEMVFSHYVPASETSSKLAEYGIITKITRRRENYLMYIKSMEEIKDFLAFLPAPVSVLRLTDLIINRELVNDSNRRKNCDLGNVNRQIEASAKQIEAIEKIEKIIGLDTLKPDLREVAVSRKENPEETLTELAQRLNVTKSCLNHRLRKIVRIADEL